ncbi:hypothetical protein NG796_05870 [Laspinema sp. A4]|nr:hypothetical protein [Laspinema sp. D2d]
MDLDYVTTAQIQPEKRRRCTVAWGINGVKWSGDRTLARSQCEKLDRQSTSN